MSLERALDVAVIDAEHLGVSTFFIHLHSPFYNVLEENQRDLVREIIGLGHDIGLHFDPAFYRDSTEQAIERNVKWEAQLLERVFDVKLSAVSFHNPTVVQTEFLATHYSGLVNCSGPRFQSDVEYCSDSNGRWNHENGFDVLERKKSGRLQMLTHPEWWITEAKPSRIKVFDIAYGRARRVLDDYDDLLRANKRVNEAGSATAVIAARDRLTAKYELLDFLWSRGEFGLVEAMLVELMDQTLVVRDNAPTVLPAYLDYQGSGDFERRDESSNQSNIEERCLMLLKVFLAATWGGNDEDVNG